MLDSVVLAYYVPERVSGGEADRARVALDRLRSDLVDASQALEVVCADLAAQGYPITPLRALEILVWTQVEGQGYYRRNPDAP